MSLMYEGKDWTKGDIFLSRKLEISSVAQLAETMGCPWLLALWILGKKTILHYANVLGVMMVRLRAVGGSSCLEIKSLTVSVKSLLILA